MLRRRGIVSSWIGPLAKKLDIPEHYSRLDWSAHMRAVRMMVEEGWSSAETSQIVIQYCRKLMEAVRDQHIADLRAAGVCNELSLDLVRHAANKGMERELAKLSAIAGEGEVSETTGGTLH